MTDDFARARRKRLAGQSNEEATPLDALGLAGDWLEDNPGAGPVVVVVDCGEGVMVFSSDSTIAQGVCILEQAKLSLLLDDDEE